MTPRHPQPAQLHRRAPARPRAERLPRPFEARQRTRARGGARGNRDHHRGSRTVGVPRPAEQPPADIRDPRPGLHADRRTQGASSGTVLPASAPYGEELELAIPPIPTLMFEPDASIATFSLDDRARARDRGTRERNAVLVPSSCPAGGFPFAAEFTYADGSSRQRPRHGPLPAMSGSARHPRARPTARGRRPARCWARSLRSAPASAVAAPAARVRRGRSR